MSSNLQRQETRLRVLCSIHRGWEKQSHSGHSSEQCLFRRTFFRAKHPSSLIVLKPLASNFQVQPSREIAYLAFPHSLLCRCRSSDSAVSGLLKSTPEEVDAATSPIPPHSRQPPPPPPPPHLYLKRGQQNRQKGSGSNCKGTTPVHSSEPADSGNLVLSRQISLHSLLEALPAASVDNDSSSEVTTAPAASSSTAVAVGPATSRNYGKKRASLSSLSLDSRSSDYDSYFYI